MVTPQINPDGISVSGCSIIYAPKGQAGEYSALATNPYRGCGRKCAYCLSGDTLITMIDGSTRTMQDIRVGDKVVGVTQGGAWSNHYQFTEVLAKIETFKPAYRITLENGISVICSGDHRWLTDRGWKYTTGTECGNTRRSHLTLNNRIRGIGPIVPPPMMTDEYRRGYLAGMIRGDGMLARYDYSGRYQRSARQSPQKTDVQYHFRLALKDFEALDRTAHYLNLFGIGTQRETFNNGYNPNHAPMQAIRNHSRSGYEAVQQLITPHSDREWQRGWLAGIFDAEGSYDNVLRIANNDEILLSTTEEALDTFGFAHVRDDVTVNHVPYVRLRGGLEQISRFFQVTTPAITRKFSIEGKMVCESFPIAQIEPLDVETPMFDIMTTCETFMANGLLSHNCYVPDFIHMPRAEFDAGAVPRENFIDSITKDARKYQAAGITDQVMLSFTTDPYPPADNILTRRTLEVLQAYGLSICTLTKGGAMALRDLDLFRPSRDSFASTLTSLDDAFSKKWERGATLPGERMDTLKRFHEAGIFTWVSLEPVLDTEATKEIIRQTSGYVDLFKVGRVNYIGLTKTTDWKRFTGEVLEVLAQAKANHYIKRDLQPFLPAGYSNPKRVQQYHSSRNTPIISTTYDDPSWQTISFL